MRKNRKLVLVVTLLFAAAVAAIAAKGTSARVMRATASANTITATGHQGQRKNNGALDGYTAGDIFTYSEGDTIAFRFDLTASGAASGNFQVRFTTNDPSGCTFFGGDSFVLGSIANDSGVSPTVNLVSTATDADETVVTLHADFSDAGSGTVNYTLTLSPTAGDCSGSSQHSRLANSPTDGGDFANIGAQNVPVPANKVIQLPDITVNKLVDRGSGFVAANAGEYCFTLDGSSVQCTGSNGSAVFQNVTPDGTHTITESQNPGYGFDHGTGSNCSFSGGTATATVAAGRPATGATCTFYNKLLPAPVVTVSKVCSAKAASTDRFAVLLNGSATGDVLDCGGSAQVQVTPGQSFTFTEAGAGTPAADLANYSIGYSAGCGGTLINGQTGTCTITNTLKAAPVVTVTKSCPNGKAAAGDRFQVKSSGTDVGSPLDCGTSLSLAPGVGVAYTLTEAAAGTTDLADYETPAYSAGCSGTLAHYGDTATCTITNTLKALPVVHVTKTCATDKAAPGDLFQVRLNGGNVGSALDCGGTLDAHPAAGAAYSVTEGAAGTTDLANYETPSYSAGCTGTLSHFGDSASCTITNTIKASPVVTVTKVCPNGKAAEGDRFQVKLGASNVGAPLDCGDSVEAHPSAGVAYAITEAAAGTTDLGNYQTPAYSPGCTGTLAHFGDSASCTITNTLKAEPVVTVQKVCTTPKAAPTDLFQVRLNGSDAGDPIDCGGSVEVNPHAGAAYAITEAAAGTTDLANYDAPQYTAACTGTLAHFGDSATCTITNALKNAPTVTVTKVCSDKAAATDRFQVELDGQAAGDPLDCGQSVDVHPAPGAAYGITEGAAGTTDLANYEAPAYSAGCSGTLPHFGDTATCTITNRLKAPPLLTIEKKCAAKAASTDLFQAKLDGQDVGNPLDCGDAVDVHPAAGAHYIVTEGAAGTTDLANYDAPGYGEGCDGTLEHFGDTATCTITNTLKALPTVTITKSCPNGTAGDGDRFQAKLDGEAAGDPMACDDSREVHPQAGTPYTITEAPAGTTDPANYEVPAYSQGCTGTLAHFGDEATCTITNTLKPLPKLTVIKHVINDNGGKAHASSFIMTVTASTPDPASFPGSESGTDVTMLPGAYNVTEKGASGYAATFSAGCKGTLARYGDTATCTVTNNDVPPPPPPPPPPPAPQADLSITKVAAPEPVTLGDNLTYTEVVTNNGPDTATGVVVTDSLPSEVVFVSVSSTKGTCTGTNAITCQLGTMAKGESISITIVARTTVVGTITNTAVVAGTQADPNTANNRASATSTVVGPFTPPSVCYRMTIRPQALTVGKRTIVKITVRERGKPVAHVGVIIRGKGINRHARTNARGVARFVIKAAQPGILRVLVPTHKTCRRQAIGVLGAFTPPVTG